MVGVSVGGQIRERIKGVTMAKFIQRADITLKEGKGVHLTAKDIYVIKRRIEIIKPFPFSPP